jgi:hypothetical protein
MFITVDVRALFDVIDDVALESAAKRLRHRDSSCAAAALD